MEGCKNCREGCELLPKVAEALREESHWFILSEKKKTTKAIGAAAGLAYNQIVGAESAVDINLAKQLNVVTTQLGVDAKEDRYEYQICSSGAMAYEYVHFHYGPHQGAAPRNDNMLQMCLLLHLYPQRHGSKGSYSF